jgi:hypothetical protein
MIRKMADAPWSTALTTPPGKAASMTVTRAFDVEVGDILDGTPPPHVASIALAGNPTADEVALACRIGERLQERGSFVIVTGPATGRSMPGYIGSDCYLAGNCGEEHHSYPARTVTEPIAGRMICYELYDVLRLWAGKTGEYGSLRHDADGLHIEVPASVGALEEVDTASGQSTATGWSFLPSGSYGTSGPVMVEFRRGTLIIPGIRIGLLDGMCLTSVIDASWPPIVRPTSFRR